MRDVRKTSLWPADWENLAADGKEKPSEMRQETPTRALRFGA